MHRAPSRVMVAILLTGAIALAGCGDDSDGSNAAADTTTTTSEVAEAKPPLCAAYEKALELDDPASLEAVQIQAEVAPPELIDEYATIENLISLNAAGGSQAELDAAKRLMAEPLGKIAGYLNDECGIVMDLLGP